MRDIGNLKLNSPFLMAPLAGITDSTFRRICAEFGASLTYTEMVSIKGLHYHDKNTNELLEIKEGDSNVGFQLFGSDPELFKEVIPTLEDRDNKLIDINMGCPVPKVVKNGEGSALLKDSDLVYRIVEAVTCATKKPVTVKIRLGWDESSINFLEIGRAIEAGGASAVTLHGRTREQFYSGNANWEYIRRLKEELNIPVIGNGDIFKVEDAFKYMDYSGVDYVMIARGALGNPFIFRELNLAYNILKNQGIEQGNYLYEYQRLCKDLGKASFEEKKNMAIDHLRELAYSKGEKRAIQEMRKHIGWYFKGAPNSAKLRGELNEINDISKLIEKIESI